MFLDIVIEIFFIGVGLFLLYVGSHYCKLFRPPYKTDMSILVWGGIFLILGIMLLIIN